MVKVIFCVNPGRSGSHYLSELFRKAGNCKSHHETEPSGFGTPLQKCNLGDCEEMHEIAETKTLDIKKATEEGMIYCETSHCFIKGFAWPIMEFIPQHDVGIIILQRDKRSVVASTIRVHSGPLNNFGRKFILTPDRHSPIIEPPRFFLLPGRLGYSVAHTIMRGVRKINYRMKWLPIFNNHLDYFKRYQEKCVSWYWEETYALGEKFKEQFPDCKYFTVTTDELNDTEKVREMMKYFGVRWSDALAGSIGKPTNLKINP